MKHTSPLCDCSELGGCVGTSPRFKCRSDNGIPFKQASAAEQGQACTNCGHHNAHTSPAGDVADACNEADCNCGYYTPTQPPAPRCTCGYDARNNERDLDVSCPVHMPVQPPEGDAQMVERMLRIYYPNSCDPLRLSPINCTLMAAALAVAREGYVSLDDVEREIQRESDLRWKEIVNNLRRNRLAKPAERERVHIQQSGNGDYMIILDGNFCFRFDRKQDAERYATGLREELKAGKQ